MCHKSGALQHEEEPVRCDASREKTWSKPLASQGDSSISRASTLGKWPRRATVVKAQNGALLGTVSLHGSRACSDGYRGDWSRIRSTRLRL